MNMLSLTQCSTIEDFRLAEEITHAYIRRLGMDLSFQDIERELDGFARIYSPSAGIYLISRIENIPAGGVGLR